MSVPATLKCSFDIQRFFSAVLITSLKKATTRVVLDQALQVLGEDGRRQSSSSIDSPMKQ